MISFVHVLVCFRMCDHLLRFSLFHFCYFLSSSFSFGTDCFRHLHGGCADHVDVGDGVLNAVVELLPSNKLWVRIHAAQCLRSVVRAAPAKLSTWLHISTSWIYAIFRVCVCFIRMCLGSHPCGASKRSCWKQNAQLTRPTTPLR